MMPAAAETGLMKKMSGIMSHMSTVESGKGQLRAPVTIPQYTIVWTFYFQDFQEHRRWSAVRFTCIWSD